MNTRRDLNELWVDLVRGRDGVTALEYAIIAGFLSIVIVVAVTSIGHTLFGTFQLIASQDFWSH